MREHRPGLGQEKGGGRTVATGDVGDREERREFRRSGDRRQKAMTHRAPSTCDLGCAAGPPTVRQSETTAAEHGRRKRMHRNTRVNQICAATVAAAFGLALAASDAKAAADPVKCRRTIAKSAAKYESTVAKSLQKCEDGRLKGTVTGSCPDSKASGKIDGAKSNAVDNITGACTGLTLTDMSFDALSSQCNGGYTPGRPCITGNDCAGACGAGSRFEGDPCVADSFCMTGLCGSETTAACTTDMDCPTGNSQCTAAATPFPCCSGLGTGSCSALNCDTTSGFCFLPQAPARGCTPTNGACLPNASCAGAGMPFACCTGAGTGTCGGTAPFTNCQQDGVACDNEHECNPVDFCPSVWNDGNSEPFGLTPSTDCYFALTDEASVADCVTCVAGNKAAKEVDSFLDDGLAATATDTLGCERTVAKAAAKHLSTV